MKPFLHLLLLLVLCSRTTGAQHLSRVGDLWPGRQGSEPYGLCAAPGRLYFYANSEDWGVELWSYDGSHPPAMVADINPGRGSIVQVPTVLHPEPHPIGWSGGRLYFMANEGSGYGEEVFCYDGSQPPFMAADVFPGPKGCKAAEFVSLNKTLYFVAEDSAHGRELFSLSGAATLRCLDVLPGTAGSSPSQLTPLNGKLYFFARPQGGEPALCAYDPASGAASVVAPLQSAGRVPDGVVVAGSKIWMVIRSLAWGSELFCSDGSGLERVTDLAPGSADGVDDDDFSLYRLGNSVYFASKVDGQGYKIDAATRAVSGGAFRLGREFLNSAWHYRTEFDDRVYFADDVSFPASSGGEELGFTDGERDTVLDLVPGLLGSQPRGMTVWNGSLYFSAYETDYGRELYRLAGGLGLASVSFEGRVSVFPNPAGGRASLEFELNAAQTLALSLVDASGKSVWQRPAGAYPAGKTVVEIPLASLAPGSYWYRLDGRNGRLLAAGRLQHR